jgi:NADH-ubiquinone oxidoreductase chain 6
MYQNIESFKLFISIAAILAGIAVITSKNPVISVFYLISLYLLVAIYLMGIGITYIGISYIIIYVGAIAILFLFIIMMIDIEVVPSSSRTRSTTPLMVFLLTLFLWVFNQFNYNLGFNKFKNVSASFNDFQNIYLELTNLDAYLSATKNGMSFQESNIENLQNNFEDFIEYPILNYEEENNKVIITKNNEDYESIKDNMNFESKNNIISDNSINSINNSKSNLGIEELDIINNTIIKPNDTIVKEVLDTSYDSFNLIYHSVIIPTWESMLGNVTQIAAIGYTLYSNYSSFLFILSILLLLGMIGAIVLTGNDSREVKVVTILKDKNIVHKSAESKLKNSKHQLSFQLLGLLDLNENPILYECYLNFNLVCKFFSIIILSIQQILIFGIIGTLCILFVGWSVFFIPWAKIGKIVYFFNNKHKTNATVNIPLKYELIPEGGIGSSDSGTGNNSDNEQEGDNPENEGGDNPNNEGGNNPENEGSNNSENEGSNNPEKEEGNNPNNEEGNNSNDERGNNPNNEGEDSDSDTLNDDVDGGDNSDADTVDSGSTAYDPDSDTLYSGSDVYDSGTDAVDSDSDGWDSDSDTLNSDSDPYNNEGGQGNSSTQESNIISEAETQMRTDWENAIREVQEARPDLPSDTAAAVNRVWNNFDIFVPRESTPEAVRMEHISRMLRTFRESNGIGRSDNNGDNNQSMILIGFLGDPNNYFSFVPSNVSEWINSLVKINWGEYIGDYPPVEGILIFVANIIFLYFGWYILAMDPGPRPGGGSGAGVGLGYPTPAPDANGVIWFPDNAGGSFPKPPQRPKWPKDPKTEGIVEDPKFQMKADMIQVDLENEIKYVDWCMAGPGYSTEEPMREWWWYWNRIAREYGLNDRDREVDMWLRFYNYRNWGLLHCQQARDRAIELANQPRERRGLFFIPLFISYDNSYSENNWVNYLLNTNLEFINDLIIVVLICMGFLIILLSTFSLVYLVINIKNNIKTKISFSQIKSKLSDFYGLNPEDLILHKRTKGQNKNKNKKKNQEKAPETGSPSGQEPGSSGQQSNSSNQNSNNSSGQNPKKSSDSDNSSNSDSSNVDSSSNSLRNSKSATSSLFGRPSNWKDLSIQQSRTPTPAEARIMTKLEVDYRLLQREMPGIDVNEVKNIWDKFNSEFPNLSEQQRLEHLSELVKMGKILNKTRLRNWKMKEIIINNGKNSKGSSAGISFSIPFWVKEKEKEISSNISSNKDLGPSLSEESKDLVLSSMEEDQDAIQYFSEESNNLFLNLPQEDREELVLSSLELYCPELVANIREKKMAIYDEFIIDSHRLVDVPYLDINGNNVTSDYEIDGFNLDNFISSDNSLTIIMSILWLVVIANLIWFMIQFYKMLFRISPSFRRLISFLNEVIKKLSQFKLSKFFSKLVNFEKKQYGRKNLSFKLMKERKLITIDKLQGRIKLIKCKKKSSIKSIYITQIIQLKKMKEILKSMENIKTELEMWKNEKTNKDEISNKDNRNFSLKGVVSMPYFVYQEINFVVYSVFIIIAYYISSWIIKLIENRRIKLLKKELKMQICENRIKELNNLNEVLTKELKNLVYVKSSKVSYINKQEDVIESFQIIASCLEVLLLAFELLNYYENLLEKIKNNIKKDENGINNKNDKVDEIEARNGDRNVNGKKMGIYVPFFVEDPKELINVLLSTLNTLFIFAVALAVVGLVLLTSNNFFSLFNLYTAKGGGFECGFTSFFQTRQRYNVVFYRVGLIFLMLDLEIFVTFPFPVALGKVQIIRKYVMCGFLVLLMIGLTYELKEGAVDITSMKVISTFKIERIGELNKS